MSSGMLSKHYFEFQKFCLSMYLNCHTQLCGFFCFMRHFALHCNVFVWITELLTIICTLEKVLNCFRGA